MRNGFYFVFLLLIVAGASCTKDDQNGNTDDTAKIVVEGYVYANEPVQNLRISRINSNGSSDLIPENGAIVFVSQGDHQIELLPVTADSGLYAQTDTLTYLLTDSTEVKLAVELNGKNYSASTTFPQKITGLQISNSQIYVIPGNTTDTIASLSWNPIANATGYCIFIRNITSNYGPLGQDSQSQSVFNYPITSTSVNFVSTDFPFSGSFEIYVTAVSANYSAMYNGQTNTIVDGTSNIQNGWGIFVGFNGDAVPVTVQ